MQTGNTVFIALGTLGTSNNWTRSLTSLLFFVAGCFSFARFHALLGGPRLRRTLLASFLLQTACIAAAAILINARAVDGAFPTPYTADVVDYPQLVAVACLSFQAGGQIVNSRGLGLNEVPTIVITSLLCDLVSDPKLFARWRANPKRDRRAAGFVLTFLGAVCGGWVSKAAGGLAPSLWWVAAMKLAIALVWIVWKKKE
ncbi:DUF1275 domain protein [Zopfochytrium polystomum]|nr:DUF1275 domain protein [Zopfochytrium polystomum]KAI9359188.1 DUF1275 domain protein [Zopfochytrium polystomum]